MVYGIGDLHFDYSKDKAMDIFGENWIEHEENIIKNWEKKVKEEDIILIPGDISWALKLEDAYFDLKRIEELPGKKVLIKGNHDYWWQSLKKINDLQLNSLFFVQNNSFNCGDISIGGTRGWIASDSEFFDESDEKVFRREVLRLENSLKTFNKDAKIKIAMTHYPPFNVDSTPNELVRVMKDFDIGICIYGHLHAEGHRHVIEGVIEGIEFHCVSSDYINFDLKLLMEG